MFSKLKARIFEPRPATSVHLTWRIPSVNNSQCVEFYNEVTVQETAKCTYFCAIQFGYGGGYCGIQQRDYPDDKIAIYSVWHQPGHDVFLVDQGPEVTVEPFGGEGTGLKSMKPFHWEIGEKVGFLVKSRLVNCEWIISCDVIFRNQIHHMATYRRGGENPMNAFIGFVEDYNRYESACGILNPRSCIFSGTTCKLDETLYSLTSASFSKVQDGSDRHGVEKCHAEVCSTGLILATGGKKKYCMAHGTQLNCSN